jgi:energy-coupling factor transporter ATP-binding protein EcfA2
MVMDFLAGSDVNGDILVIKGESGSGKSTLANLMKNTIFKIHPGPRAHKIHSRTRFPGPSYDINFDQCTNKRGRFVFVELEEGCGIGLPQLASIAKMMDEGINLVIVDPKNATDNCFFGI